MFKKDYYSILGVLPTAEDIVIRAAYRALAQRYHPDKYQGDPDEAERLMQEINEAYSILSDQNKKQQYDTWFNGQQTNEEYQAEEEDDELAAALRAYDKDWNTACEIYPDLRSVFTRLNTVAARLALTYKIFLLETRQFRNRLVIADSMEKEFFQSYFGKNPEIFQFARELVYSGHKQAAKALNNYVRVLGSDIDAYRIINKISGEHDVPNKQKRQEEIKAQQWKEAKDKQEATKQESLLQKTKLQTKIKDSLKHGVAISNSDIESFAEALSFTGTSLTKSYFKCHNCNYYGPVEQYKQEGFFKSGTTFYKCPICYATDNVILM